jgi:hypothetical protein
LKQEHALATEISNKALKEENAALKARISELIAVVDSVPNSELSSLQFDKEALENKLRKFASHCQSLEDERVTILQVLRSAVPLQAEDDDIEKAIVVLCDKLASLEKECESMSESRKSVSTSFLATDNFRSQNLSLQKQDNELRQQIRCLEQENLKLIVDLRALKKQLQNTNSQLNVLQMQSSGNLTNNLTSTRSPVVSNKRRSAQKDTCSASKRARTVASKENERNESAQLPISKNSASKQQLASSQKTPRATGLGEASDATEENTQECIHS